jgi:hypothetical protein
MAFASRYSPTVAKNRGNQSYLLILDNWGNLGAGTDAESIQYTFPLPVVGAQIGPSSDVGEVILTYNSNQPDPDITSPKNRESQDDIYIKRGDPYVWRTPAGITIFATNNTRHGDTYYPAPDAPNPLVTEAFTGASATLELMLFFDGAPYIRACAHRPLGASATILPFNDLNTRLNIWPIQHRPNLRVVVDNQGADPIECRFGGGYVPGPPDSNTAVVPVVTEYELDAAPLIVPPFSRAPAAINTQNDVAAWLLVHTTKQAATGATTVNFLVQSD